MQIAKNDHIPVMLRKLGEFVGDRHCSLFHVHRAARGIGSGRNELGVVCCRPIDGRADLLDRYFATNVSFSSFHMFVDNMVEAMDQDLAEPSNEFSFRLSPEIGEVSMRREEGLLDQVGRTDPTAKSLIELGGSQNGEIVAVPLEHHAYGRLISLLGLFQLF